jgi:ABC-type nitrate/sulfonate/bicarbonate transport system permease component
MKWKRLLPPLGLLVLWQAVSALGIVPGFKLPSPLQVFSGFSDLIQIGMPPGHRLHVHIYHSLLRVFWGYAAAVVTAVPLGLVMGWSSTIRNLLEPVVELIRPVPPLAWIPLAILWFGIGNQSAAFIIFLGAFFPILLNTVNGVLSIDPILIDAAHTLNAPKRFIFLNVLIPGAVPAILTGMRIGIGIGWMTLVAAEFTGIREGYGLGYMIMTARDIQRPDEIIAGMMVIGVIGFCIDELIQWMKRYWIKWN